MITGASSGIGAEFAQRLAQRGYDLVLVARGADALEALAAQIDASVPAAIEVLPADLTAPAQLAMVASRAKECTLLVNSAGYGLVGDVTELTGADQVDMLRLNVEALTVLSREAAIGMSGRGDGAIINVASTAGFQPIPHEAVYAASKAYVHSFSQALAEEVGPAGVRVLSVCPGFTETAFAARAGAEFERLPSVMVSSPEHVVSCALSDLDRGRAVSIPGYLNAAIAASSKVAPGWLTRKVSAQLTRRTQP
ncbi:MAG: uncharacterized protein QG597_1084 [Actinomycetota bacterium]|nr:uncharacterized protein [Actinomycetota bacterium]